LRDTGLLGLRARLLRLGTGLLRLGAGLLGLRGVLLAGLGLLTRYGLLAGRRLRRLAIARLALPLLRLLAPLQRLLTHLRLLGRRTLALLRIRPLAHLRLTRRDGFLLGLCARLLLRLGAGALLGDLRLTLLRLLARHGLCPALFGLGLLRLQLLLAHLRLLLACSDLLLPRFGLLSRLLGLHRCRALLLADILPALDHRLALLLDGRPPRGG